LRRINANGTSSSSRLKNGESITATPFRWPEGINVVVECDDWDSRPVCGGGLHGWPWGMGLGEGADYDIIDDRWIILAAAPEDVAGNLERGWKCKCRMAIKLYDGPFAGAWAMINGGRHRLIEAMSKGMSDSSKAASSGYSSKAASSGDYSTAASSGYSSTAASSGDSSKAASSGYSSTAASSGDSSKAASSGDSSKAASSGDSSKAASSGDYSTAASSGDSSKAASSGYSSTAASSGDSSKAASSGDSSKAASSGDSSKADAKGKDTAAAVVGSSGRVRVGERGAFAIACWNESEGWRFLVGKVGENGIKADTWYAVENGTLVEAKD
jgi:hypothetical protein